MIFPVNDAPTWLAYLPVLSVLLLAFGEYRRVPPTRFEAVIVRSAPLLAIPDGTSVTVTVDGRPVRNASVVVMRCTNTGKTALATQSWESSLEIEMISGSLISARQVAARPQGLRVDITVSRDKAQIKPLLVNPGDIFDIQLVCQDLTSRPVPHARITNVTGIKVRRRPVYAPGSGLDGEMITPDKVMVFVAFPVLLVFIGLLGVLAPSEPGVALLAATSASSMLVLLLGFERLAVRRSRRWRPIERF